MAKRVKRQATHYVNLDTGGIFAFRPDQLLFGSRTPEEAIEEWRKATTRGEFQYSYALCDEDHWTPKMFKEL